MARRAALSLRTTHFLLVVAGSLAGCVMGGGTAVVSAETKFLPFRDEEVVSRANSLAEAGASRQQVIDALGDPWIGSEKMRVDVFRKTGTPLLLFWMLLPLPIPIILPGPQFAAYTLVSYDATGNVDAAEAAVVSKSMGASTVTLRAGDYTLWTAFERDYVLLATTGERFLREVVSADHGTSCTLLIGTSAIPQPSLHERSVTCVPNVIRIDGGPQKKIDFVPSYPWGAHSASPTACGTGMPCIWFGLLYPVVFEQGNHDLHFGSTRVDGGFNAEYSCKNGETTFAGLFCGGEESGEVRGSAVLSPELPYELSSDLVLVNRGGRWLIDENRLVSPERVPGPIR